MTMYEAFNDLMSISKALELLRLEAELKQEIIQSLKQQGFKITENYEILPNGVSKEDLKKAHHLRKLEQLKKRRKFILNKNNLKLVKEYSVNGDDLEVDSIKVVLKKIETDEDVTLFRWWNLTWWSLPYERPFGRQIRYLLWDKTHDAVFGLVQLQSPPLHSKVRDSYLGLTRENKDYWLNQSMYAQRVGAVPPYNYLLGGKLVAMSLVSKELRQLYVSKYKGKKTILRERKLPTRLLFITTTSAYGKSSMYERLKYGKIPISIFIGYTQGSGTFHISDSTYQKLIRYLQLLGVNTKRGYGTGPSRKLRLISKAFRELGFKSKNGKPFVYHNIKRGYYLFPHVSNLNDVVHKGKKPKYYKFTMSDLYKYWYNRWLLPRSQRCTSWRKFNIDQYIENVRNEIKG